MCQEEHYHVVFTSDKDSYSSAEMTESQLIKFMGKKKPTLDMMWGGKNLS